jgi:hypothetical protein
LRWMGITVDDGRLVPGGQQERLMVLLERETEREGDAFVYYAHTPGPRSVLASRSARARDRDGSRPRRTAKSFDTAKKKNKNSQRGRYTHKRREKKESSKKKKRRPTPKARSERGPFFCNFSSTRHAARRGVCAFAPLFSPSFCVCCVGTTRRAASSSFRGGACAQSAGSIDKIDWIDRLGRSMAQGQLGKKNILFRNEKKKI